MYRELSSGEIYFVCISYISLIFVLTDRKNIMKIPKFTLIRRFDTAAKYNNQNINKDFRIYCYIKKNIQKLLLDAS